MKKTIDWDEFKRDISGVSFYDEKAFVASRSKDYYWYSPLLSEVLEDKVGDIVVIPSNQTEVMKVAAAVAKHKIPLTIRGGGTGNSFASAISACSVNHIPAIVAIAKPIPINVFMLSTKPVSSFNSFAIILFFRTVI